VPTPAADELRPITALFADIVGSTALGERLSPDEVKTLVGECVSRMASVVERFGGWIQAYMGDGLAACFGVPAAHEDDPERAAAAALEILVVVERYAADILHAWGIADFNVRVGIQSGRAAVGELGQEHADQGVFGDVMNVAARLQAAAEPGTVMVGDRAASRLGGRFVLEPLGDIAVRGREATVTGWRLVGRDPGDRREVYRLIGRREELARLTAALEDLRAGRGQAVLILGEAGMGKTRLLSELRGIASDHVTWLDGECPSYGADALYWPFVEMLRSWLGITQGEPEILTRTRLRARMQPLLGDEVGRVVPFLGQLLSTQLEPDEGEALGRLSAEEFATQIQSAFRSWIGALCRERPVVVAIEALHEADSATREVLQELLSLTDEAPLMLIGTSRLDVETEGWRFRVHAMTQYAHRIQELLLQPLPDEESERLLEEVAPQPPDELTRREIISRAEGNPLYLEELLHAVEISESMRSRTWTITAGSWLLLPPQLEALLVARIDRLGDDARNLAQAAAAIGRQFPASVLEQVAGHDRFQAGLAELLRAHIVREFRRYPELEYTFRTGMLQEAALSTLTPARREDLYGRIARAFEDVLPSSLEERMEMLAHYYARSRDLPKALYYLERAGARAASLDQTDQALRLWERAVRVAEQIGDEESVLRMRRYVESMRPGADA